MAIGAGIFLYLGMNRPKNTLTHSIAFIIASVSAMTYYALWTGMVKPFPPSSIHPQQSNSVYLILLAVSPRSFEPCTLNLEHKKARFPNPNPYQKQTPYTHTRSTNKCSRQNHDPEKNKPNPESGGEEDWRACWLGREVLCRGPIWRRACDLVWMPRGLWGFLERNYFL